MAPKEYSFRLQKGITGGFAPPTPNAIYTVTREQTKQDLQISRATREQGKPAGELQDLAPKSLPVSDTDHLIDELHTILKTLPTENPPASEDIYGLDTSIFWLSEDLQWCNGGPQGCGGGKSTVQPTAEQKDKFKRAVDIVHHLCQ